MMNMVILSEIYLIRNILFLFLTTKRLIMISNLSIEQKKQIDQELISRFPKPPYQVQRSIAKLIFSSLEEGRYKLGIIESPTGTGKTYSLLVPLITWLARNRTKLKAQEQKSVKKVVIPSWLKKPSQQKMDKIVSQKKKKIDKIISIENAQNQLKKRRLQHSKKSILSEQDDIQLDSQQQNKQPNFKRNLLKKQDILTQKQLKIQDQTIPPKIIFVSRTHSQLSQVIQSLKLVIKPQDEMRYLQIASKQHLCVNTQVNCNTNSVAQRCQYLLDHSKCQFFHNLEIKQFFDTEIEKSKVLGTNHTLCPYYATRNLMEYCDILCLPYASILDSKIRNRIGINIHNSIIVFDEGHNVIQNQKQLHSPEIFRQDMILLCQQIDEYLKKYSQRMKISNYKILVHFLEIIRSMIIVMEKYQAKCSKQTQKSYVKINFLEFIGEMNVKQLKIYKIMKYIQLNNIDQKLAFFNSNPSSLNKKGKNEPNSKISVGKINNILNFINEFNQFDQSKQILLLKWNDGAKGSMKILCLETVQLEKIVRKSRMTVIAGGTMQPLDDFKGLFSTFSDSYFFEKYPHIIKKEQCSVLIIKKYLQKQILFNHNNFQNPKTIQFLTQSCIKIITKIIQSTQKGGGIVVFIQNYRLITFFKDIFKNSPFFKYMIFDGKEESKQNISVFEKYKQNIESNPNNNYILFSVMGGKLSEGINFSDRLARSIIVLGLPYSNIYAPEVIETISHLQSNKKSTKKEYLQSLCMRTLNQTIGRGVRHINDYVKIYLIDTRFDGVKDKLSAWMKDRIKVVQNVQDAQFIS